MKKIWTFREYAPPKTVKKRLPRPIDADVMDEVRRLVNNFESDSEPDTVTLNQLRLHSIKIGRVRIDYKKKKKILFQDQIFGANNDTITEPLD